MHRNLVPLLVIALSATTLSGCFGGGGGTALDDDGTSSLIDYYANDFFPADLDHDHTDPTLHTVSHNVEFVDHHDCTEDGVYDRSSTPTVTDLKEKGQFLYVNQDNGFCILDISNPANVTFVSHFEAPAGFDIDVSEDGNWVFHGTQRNPLPSDAADVAMSPEDDYPRGLYIVDVSDKADPSFESFYPVPTNGVHTVHYHKHQNGDDLVLIQTYDWIPPGELGADAPVPSVNSPATQRVEITRLVPTAGAHELERLAVYQMPKPPTEPAGDYFPHDCTAQKHPFTEKTYMYCAYWDHGMVIVDITDPTSPVTVSQYNDLAPSQYNQYHYVLPSDDLIEGRHITVAAPELQQGVGEAGYVRVFDTTDPTQPEQLGAWTLPGVDGFGGGFLFSPHQFDLAGGMIYMGHNHGGVWVIDISNETNLREPKSAAFFFPHGDEDASNDTWPRMGQVWVAVEHDGYVYSTDRVGGVHVHQYVHDARTADAPASVSAPA